MRNFQANPLDFISAIKNGKNPEQVLLTFLGQNGTNLNPMLINLVNLAKNGKTAEVEQIARNLAKERGIDYDREFNAFKNTWGLK
jgi:hypothetical protein